METFSRLVSRQWTDGAGFKKLKSFDDPRLLIPSQKKGQLNQTETAENYGENGLCPQAISVAFLENPPGKLNGIRNGGRKVAAKLKQQQKKSSSSWTKSPQNPTKATGGVGGGRLLRSHNSFPNIVSETHKQQQQQQQDLVATTHPNNGKAPPASENPWSIFNFDE
jgi:hypothetical protein